MESVLDQAKEREKEYDWVKAAGVYGQALRVVGKNDFLEKGKIQERTGYCFFRAAFQADTQEEFKKRMGLSVETYEEAARFFEELEDSKKHARTGFCRGTALYSKSWLTDDSSERKALLDECRKIEKETLQAYEETGDRAEYGKTCNELLTCLLDRLAFTWDWQERKDILEEAVEHGEKAIDALSEAKDDCELSRACCMLSLHLIATGDIHESIEKQEESYQKGLTYAQKALEISEKVEDSYLIGWSCLAIAGFIMEFKGDSESSLRYREKALELGKRMNDKLMIAQASDMLSYNVWWKALVEEDPDKRRKGFNRAIQYIKDAITHYQLVSLPPLAGVGEGSYIWSLASDETSLEKKQVLLEKVVEVGRRDLGHAKRSGLPWHIYCAFHSLSKALFSLSTMETRKIEKRKLLEEASKHREETVKLTERLSPFDYWNRGVIYRYLARIKAEQANNETDSQRKIDLLKKAVLDMEDCLKFCRTAIKAKPQTRLTDIAGYFQYDFGGILNQLYLLTREQKHLERAIMVYEEAVQAWEKADRRSNIAETHWQMAKLYDQLGKFSEAAQEFESASERYRLAADKIPQLKTFYTDYAIYMRAWSEIEKAKHRHTEKQYGLAKEH